MEQQNYFDYLPDELILNQCQKLDNYELFNLMETYPNVDRVCGELLEERMHARSKEIMDIFQLTDEDIKIYKNFIALYESRVKDLINWDWEASISVSHQGNLFCHHKGDIGAPATFLIKDVSLVAAFIKVCDFYNKEYGLNLLLDRLIETSDPIEDIVSKYMENPTYL